MSAKQPVIPPLATPTVEVPVGMKFREQWIGYKVKMNNWTTGAELGVWKGRTFLSLLRNCHSLKTLYGVDLWEPQPDNEGPENYLDWPHEENERIVREGAARFGDRAVVMKMTTNEAAKLIEDESIDFVFIDADHSSEAVAEDIKNWAPKVKKDGWIIGHDINWPTVEKVVNEKFTEYEIGPDNVWGAPKCNLKS